MNGLLECSEDDDDATFPPPQGNSHSTPHPNVPAVVEIVSEQSYGGSYPPREEAKKRKAGIREKKQQTQKE